ncbi:MAG: hypothetical protein FIB08_01385 [Candidatus Methanoperedens sp.]|nr:hypothetical protein [Candidatus Methanoperedens sp.]
MIEIKNGRIYFYNTLKPDLMVLDFKCLSAYVCPACKNVLRAYFVGSIIPESLKEYMEKDTMKYAYEMGNTQGAQWLALRDHSHKECCRWEVVGAMSKGIENSVKSFIEIHNIKIKDTQALMTAIGTDKMPGFKRVFDETGADLPMLLFKESDLLNTAGMTFEKKWELLRDLSKTIDSVLRSIGMHN